MFKTYFGPEVNKICMSRVCSTRTKLFSNCYFLWWYSQKTRRYDNFIELFSVFETIRERLNLTIWDIARILGNLWLGHNWLQTSCLYFFKTVKILHFEKLPTTEISLYNYFCFIVRIGHFYQYSKLTTTIKNWI